MTLWQALSPFNQQLSLLVAVLLAKIILQRIVPHAPWRGFRFYCEKLADKVNKRENSQSQQGIAGFVATLITLAPLVTILWLFETLVAIPMIWQAILLYLALGAGDIFSVSQKVAQAISASDKYKAKQTLAPYVLRDTDNLSPMGLSKAAIEMQILSHLQQYIVVIALFLLVGPLAAISYRLCLEMHYSWNIKVARFEYFGRFSNQLIQFIQWLPIRLFLLVSLILTLGQNFILTWRLTVAYFFQANNNAVLSFFATAHNIRLGGVAMYKGMKLRRASFNDNGSQPQPKDIIYVQRFIWRIYIVHGVILLAISIFTQLI